MQVPCWKGWKGAGQPCACPAVVSSLTMSPLSVRQMNCTYKIIGYFQPILFTTKDPLFIIFPMGPCSPPSCKTLPAKQTRLGSLLIMSLCKGYWRQANYLGGKLAFGGQVCPNSRDNPNNNSNCANCNHLLGAYYVPLYTHYLI